MNIFLAFEVLLYIDLYLLSQKETNKSKLEKKVEFNTTFEGKIKVILKEKIANFIGKPILKKTTF